MLKKHNRLPAFIRFSSPHFCSSQSFSVRCEKNGLDVSRFGFIIGKKQAKRAVERNRIKRVFRSCIEEDLEKITKGYDMLFFLTKSILVIKREDLYNEVHTVLKKEQLLI